MIGKENFTMWGGKWKNDDKDNKSGTLYTSSLYRIHAVVVLLLF
jgi:hypothetical protein